MRIRGTGAAISVLVLWGCGGGGGGGSEAPHVEEKPAGPPPIVGVLDESFGVGGIAAFDGGGEGNDRGNAILRDAQGGILIAGSAWSSTYQEDMALWRLDEFGTPDPDFGEAGVALDNRPYSQSGLGMALDLQGRIVVVGFSIEQVESALAIWRFNPNGTIDTSFNEGTGVRFHRIDDAAITLDRGTSVAIDASNRIVVTGRSTLENAHRMVLWRFDPDGSLDSNFGDLEDANLAPFPDARKGFAVFQPLEVSNSEGNSLALDSEGRIAITGRGRIVESESMIVWRYLPNGTFDPFFGEVASGFVSFDIGPGNHCIGNSIKVDPQGKLLVAGGVRQIVGGEIIDRMAVWRYNPEGTLDTTFHANDGPNVVVGGYTLGSYGVAESLVLDQEGRIVVVGSTTSIEIPGELLVARFDPNGAVDRTFGDVDPENPSERTGYLTWDRVVVGSGSDERGEDVVLDEKGRILVAGSSTHAGLNIDRDMMVWRFR